MANHAETRREVGVRWGDDGLHLWVSNKPIEFGNLGDTSVVSGATIPKENVVDSVVEILSQMPHALVVDVNNRLHDIVAKQDTEGQI